MTYTRQDYVDTTLKNFLENSGVDYKRSVMENMRSLSKLREAIELGMPSKYDLDVIKHLSLIKHFSSIIIGLKNKILKLYSERK